MNVPSVILKSTLLSASIFWIIVMSEDFNLDMIPFIFFSFIPISLCCLITILFTITPFFWLKKMNMSNNEVYKKWFPYYAIICFSLCFYGVIKSNFNIYPISFLASAFFTTMQSWIWFAKANNAQ